ARWTGRKSERGLTSQCEHAAPRGTVMNQAMKEELLDRIRELPIEDRLALKNRLVEIGDAEWQAGAERLKTEAIKKVPPPQADPAPAPFNPSKCKEVEDRLFAASQGAIHRFVREQSGETAAFFGFFVNFLLRSERR